MSGNAQRVKDDGGEILDLHVLKGGVVDGLTLDERHAKSQVIDIVLYAIFQVCFNGFLFYFAIKEIVLLQVNDVVAVNPFNCLLEVRCEFLVLANLQETETFRAFNSVVV